MLYAYMRACVRACVCVCVILCHTMSLQPSTGRQGVRHNHGETLQGSWLYRLVMAGHGWSASCGKLLSQWQASLAQLGRRQEHSRIACGTICDWWGWVVSCGMWRKWEERVHVAADQERGNAFFSEYRLKSLFECCRTRGVPNEMPIASHKIPNSDTM